MCSQPSFTLSADRSLLSLPSKCLLRITGVAAGPHTRWFRPCAGSEVEQRLFSGLQFDLTLEPTAIE